MGALGQPQPREFLCSGQCRVGKLRDPYSFPHGATTTTTPPRLHGLDGYRNYLNMVNLEICMVVSLHLVHK